MEAIRPSPLALVAVLVSALAAGCDRASEAAPTADGARIFALACARCHGPDGGGGVASAAGQPAPRNFHDEAFQAARSDEQLRQVIRGGKGGAMPAFGAAFNAHEIDALVAHLRTLRRNP